MALPIKNRSEVPERHCKLCLLIHMLSRGKIVHEKEFRVRCLTPVGGDVPAGWVLIDMRGGGLAVDRLGGLCRPAIRARGMGGGGLSTGWRGPKRDPLGL